MNLLIYAPQMAAYGGMERHVVGVAALMSARGHCVNLLTTSHSLGAPLRRELATAGVRLEELPIARGSAPAAIKLLWLKWRLLRLRGVKWDVIYTNGQSGLARHVWRAAGPTTRRVHHHHTAADAAERSTWSPDFRRVLVEAGEVVACSRATATAIGENIGRRDVIFLPYLAACPMSGEEVQEREVTDAPLRFGFVGRLIPEKGLDRVLRLAAEPALADLEWHVHGAGPAYPPERFASQPRVVYHGAYSGEAEHAAILRSLDAVVLPSTHNEGMPLSLIEGMSAGLPWLATDQGGTRELALEPDCVRVVPADVNDAGLAAAVRELAAAIRSGAASRRRQRAAYDRVFAPAVVGARWAEFFERGIGASA